MEDKIIASTFKSLAKAFVAIGDINKLKENNINKLNKMDDEKFQRRYAKAYEAIKELPVNLKTGHGINKDMTKEQVIKEIESLDKKKIYETIDCIPDEFIARLFKQYLNKRKEGIQKSNIVEQINRFWSKTIKRANIPDASTALY